ncbi:MAG TPA: 3-isopropylmalate dehydratase large subunit [Kofleriaceae bacterium]|nr:3-isopropylmalate dehydratase large subunit [Kofleriaceae bacterium]
MSHRTLFEKIWDAHVVSQAPPADVSSHGVAPAMLYIDLHLVHEVTSPQAFSGLRNRGLSVRRPERTLATLDHSTPTIPGAPPIDEAARAQLAALAKNCDDTGVQLFGLESDRRGIVHVIGPEMGATQPGMTIVCGDSHTSTHGAFGALAFGIGTTEVEHVLATQCLLQKKPKTFEVRLEGELSPGVTAKDVILAVIAEIGVGAGAGHVIEYTGSLIPRLSMDERMTICNMSIEAGARAGLMAPDEVTFAFLKGRERAPSGDAWDAAVARWSALRTDPGATYDRSVAIDVSAVKPMITFGTNPGMGIAIDQPLPASGGDDTTRGQLSRALGYMALSPGQPLLDHPVDCVFIGSCTNGRISDLRAAASILRGRKVAEGVRALVVPGSFGVKRQAEAEGLDQVFLAAGAQWRDPGCSMCLAMNGDKLSPGEYAVSTSNRNFEGRQGPGGRTFLASPLTAAACAVAGKVADPRSFLAEAVS